MLGECFGEAWGGLFFPRSASLGKLGKLGEAWGMLGNASGRLGEAWGMLGNSSGRVGEAWTSLGPSQPAKRMLLEHLFALSWPSQLASQAHDRLVLSTVCLEESPERHMHIHTCRSTWTDRPPLSPSPLICDVILRYIVSIGYASI